MPIIAKNEGGNYKLVPANVYPARCINMIELGSQTSEFQGQTKTARQVNIVWELPTELEVFHEDRGLEPFVVGKTYNLSMHENANLRKDLESWRGKPFTEDEAKEFDITNLLGKQCQIQIIHKKSADGSKTYANINTITPLMKGVEMPLQINPSKILSFDDFDYKVYDELPEWLKKKIAESPEFKALKGYNESMPDTKHESTEPSDLPF
jgi:hypothetical protein